MKTQCEKIEGTFAEKKHLQSGKWKICKQICVLSSKQNKSQSSCTRMLSVSLYCSSNGRL